MLRAIETGVLYETTSGKFRVKHVPPTAKEKIWATGHWEISKLDDPDETSLVNCRYLGGVREWLARHDFESG